MENKLLIIYHSADLDGKSSAFLVFHKFNKEYSVDFFPYNYEGPSKYQKYNSVALSKYSKIVIVDINDLGLYKYIYTHSASHIIIIDHHEWTKEYFEFCNNCKIEYEHNKEFSTVQLVWQKFFIEDSGWNYIPNWVQLLGDYDRWYNRDEYYWENFVLPFQFYMRSVPNEPIDNIWKQLYHNDYIVTKFINYGKLILDYDRQQRKLIVQDFAYEMNFHGLKAIVCNSPLKGSQLFDSIWDEEKYDIMIVYNYDGKNKEYIYSLYTTKDNVDCSELARKYNGGGHKKAAGFRHKENLCERKSG